MTDYSFTPLHILLVEDNADDALLLRKTLSRVPGAAFEWTEAPTLRLAIEGLAERSFDAILLDLGLPDSRGIDTFREVFGKAPDTPIVVMTGLDDESLALAAVRQGAQDYLVKGEAEPPLISRSLRYAVERAINEKALRDAREQLEGQSRELAAANRRLEVYARLVDQSPDLMCVIDRQGVYRMVNPTFERLHYDRVESGMVGRSYAEVLGPESAEVIRPNLERAF
ncbi:MAG: response regulator, partial [Candidatus Sumerlaeota bacterium]|nr:response regulator [Candidatus Sumerlaeota bacterium]